MIRLGDDIFSCLFNKEKIKQKLQDLVLFNT
jgi:hypothetical protein